jgi:hypothetical protein
MIENLYSDLEAMGGGDLKVCPLSSIICIANHPKDPSDEAVLWKEYHGKESYAIVTNPHINPDLPAARTTHQYQFEEVFEDPLPTYPLHIKNQPTYGVSLPIINSLFDGYNCSLLCIGHTLLGKSRSLFGRPGVVGEEGTRTKASFPNLNSRRYLLQFISRNDYPFLRLFSCQASSMSYSSQSIPR